MRTAVRVCVICAAVAAPCLADPFHLPDAELMTSDFERVWGNLSTIDGVTDLPGPGVGFFITLHAGEPGKILIGDSSPINPAAGLLVDPRTGDNTSLHLYDSYEMTVQYLGGPPGSAIHLALYMNTGRMWDYGVPPNTPSNNTFWGGEWVRIVVGEVRTLTLDFDAAEAWQISDNLWPHTGGGLGWPDGGIYAINDLDRREIINIGIQTGDFEGYVNGQQIVLDLNIPEPASVTVCLLGLAALAVARRGR